MKSVPNALTTLRIFLALYLPFSPSSAHLTIILVAMSTEILDGLLARLLNAKSLTGAILDPVADKLFFLSVAITWLMGGALTWVHLCLLAAREIGIFLIIVYFVLSKRHHQIHFIKPMFWGKFTTTLQYFAFFYILWSGTSLGFIAIAAAISGIFACSQYWAALIYKETNYKKERIYATRTKLSI